MTLHKKVCIIGAGVSGLKAAHALLHKPKTPFQATDVVVVEAMDRIGGRIRTVSSSLYDNVTYDLGAAWFHDSLTNNVLLDSLADGSFDAAKDGYFDDKAVKFFTGEVAGSLDILDLKLDQVLAEFERYIEIYFSTSLDTADMSLKELAAIYVKERAPLLTELQVRYLPRMARYLELWYGVSHEKISGKYAVMNHQGRNLYNKKGYSFVIEKLARQLHCDILLKEQVVSIRRDVPGKPYSHLVTTRKGTEIACDYLVVTVPLSVLSLPGKHSHGITWDPPLPSAVSQALLSVHFGALGKVVLEFDTIWWDANEDRFMVLSDGVEDETSSENIDSFQYPIYVVNYARVNPPAMSLVVLTQSPVTDHLEARPDLAWEYLKPMLEKLQVKPISNPVNVIVTDWTQNPYARGSYSALYVGDDPTEGLINLSGEYDTCGLGAHSTIRFAGEHTIADGAGCVHGAYDSGAREASWILKHAGW